jgi:CRP-like cAMP-binding protein
MENYTKEKESCGQCSFQCIFAGLNMNQDSNNYSHIREISFRKGEIIFKQGTFGSKIIYLKEGLVKVIVEGDRGKDLLVKFFVRGMYIGLNQLFGRNESNYTAIAIKNSKVCMIEINFFRKQFSLKDNIKEEVFKLMAYENQFLRERLVVLGTKHNLGRLTNTLLYMSDENLDKENIYKFITRKDLADFSDMSVESLERLLAELKRDGLIKINGKEIEILNRRRIEEIRRMG